MEEQDQKIAENRLKLINSRKLQEEQAEKVKQMDMERKRREEEAKKINEQKADEEEKTKKLTQYANITGAWDVDKIRAALKMHKWDLQTAISAYFSKSEQKHERGEGEPE